MGTPIRESLTKMGPVPAIGYTAITLHWSSTILTRFWQTPLRLLLAVFFGIVLFQRCGLPAPFVVEGQHQQFVVADDSMITFRVAANIAAHKGPYFNENERTAANTSCMWPYAMAPVFRVLADRGRCVLALSILSCLVCAVAVGLTVFWTKSLLAAATAALTLYALPMFPAYGNSAWEHLPQMLLVTMAFAVLLGRVKWAERSRQGIALAILAVAFWVRPDTLPLMLPLAVAMVVEHGAEARWKNYAALAFAAAMVAIYFGVQHHLYDTFVPNTYYLKVHLGAHALLAGARYWAVSALDSGITLFVVGLVGFYSVDREHFTTDERTVLAGLVLQSAYIVLVGGDVFLYGRFFILMAPITIMLFWEKFWSGSETPTARVVLASVCLLGVFTAGFRQYLLTVEGSPLVYRRDGVTATPDTVANQVVLTTFLRDRIHPTDGQIGLFYLGALAFYLPEYTVADFLGKADPVIAHEPVKWGPVGHNKWDIEHTLRDRHVSVVPFDPIPDEVARDVVDRRRDQAGQAVLQLSPYMQAHYTYRSARELGNPGTQGLLIRNDLLDRFPLAVAVSTK